MARAIQGIQAEPGLVRVYAPDREARITSEADLKLESPGDTYEASQKFIDLLVKAFPEKPREKWYVRFLDLSPFRVHIAVTTPDRTTRFLDEELDGLDV